MQIAAGGGSLLALALLPVANRWFRSPGANLPLFFLGVAPIVGFLGATVTLVAVLSRAFDATSFAARISPHLLALVGFALPLLGLLLGAEPEGRGMALLAVFGALALAAGIAVHRRSRWAPTAERGFALSHVAGGAWLALSAVAAAELGPLFLIVAFGFPFALLAVSAGAMVPPPPRPGLALLLARRPPEPPRPDPMQEATLRLACRILVGLAFSFWFLLLLAFPNLHRAIGRGRQRSTLADLRAIATSVEGFAVDEGAYPDARTLDELEALVSPTYIRRLPRVDAWGWPLEYHPVTEPARSDGDPPIGPRPSGPQAYVIRSPGRDGRFELDDPTAYPGRPVEGLDRDLVFATGSGSQWPLGTMGP